MQPLHEGQSCIKPHRLDQLVPTGEHVFHQGPVEIRMFAVGAATGGQMWSLSEGDRREVGPSRET